MEFEEVMEFIARSFEVVGVAIIVLGGGYGLAKAIMARPGVGVGPGRGRAN